MKSKERLREIVGVVKKYHLIKDTTPEGLRLAIEELGPTFIKLGQIMASRDDVIPKEYCDELSKLRNEVKPMDFSLVKSILDEEYDGKTDDIFDKIFEDSIGSASIAQVHRATLKDGNDVVIKIQRKNIYEKMEMDVKLIKKIYSYLHLDYFITPVIDFNDVLDELFDIAKEEMNFLIEADHTIEFYENNKDVAYINSPQVYKDFSTSKVLVMEYLNGINIDNFEALKLDGYDMDEIGKKLAANYIKQAIDDGFFHADPHNENLKIKNGKIIYLDFGMMGRLSKKDRELLSKCIIAILKDDVTEISHILLTLGDSKDVNVMQLKSDIKMVLNKNMTKNASDIDIKTFLNDFMYMMTNNRINLPKDITMLIRGIIVIEGVLKEISPNINLVTILGTHVKPSNLFNDSPEKVISKGLESGANLVSIPDEVLNFLKGVNSGELQFNVELDDSKHQMRNLQHLVHMLIVAILDFAYILGTSLIVVKSEKLPFIFYIYLIFGGFCTLWIFYKMIESKFKNRR